MNRDQTNIIMHEFDVLDLSDITEYHPYYNSNRLLSKLTNGVDVLEERSSPCYRNNLAKALFSAEDDMVHWHKRVEDIIGDGIQLLECSTTLEEVRGIVRIIRSTEQTVTIISDNQFIQEALRTELGILKEEFTDYTGSRAFNFKDIAIFLQIFKVCLHNKDIQEVIILLQMLGSFSGYSEDEFQSVLCDIDYKARSVCFSINKLNNESRKLISELYNALSPISSLLRKKRIAINNLFSTHVSVLQGLVGCNKVYNNVKDILAYISDVELSRGTVVTENEYDKLIFGILQDSKLYNAVGHPSRVRIIDKCGVPYLCDGIIIVSNFNEGEWPSSTCGSIFCSNFMRNSLGFRNEENIIGDDAFLLRCILQKDEIYLTRSDYNVEGEEIIQSRWLLYLRSILDNSLSKLIFPSIKNSFVAPMVRPSVSIPRNMMPLKYSASMIESLLRDPYTFYLRYILKLKVSNEVLPLPSVLEFGNLIHKVFELYIKNGSLGKDYIYNIGKQEISKYIQYDNVRVFWWKKFKRMADEFIKYDDIRRDDCGDIEVEKEYFADISGLTISAKCDRVEFKHDGTIAIIDYKTGDLPTKVDISYGFSPQLLVQALVAEKMTGKRVSEVIYWQFKEKNVVKEQSEDRKITIAQEGSNRCVEFKEMKFTRDDGTKYDLSVLLDDALEGLSYLSEYVNKDFIEFVALSCPKKGWGRYVTGLY